MTTAELQRIRKLFEEAERLAQLGHYEWDEIKHRYTYCSEGMARLLGTTVNEYTRKINASAMNGLEAYLKFVHPDDHATYLAACDEYVHSRTGFQLEYRMLTVQGDCIEVREVLELEHDVDGKLVRTFGYVQDITKFKHMERDLRQIRDELELRVADRTSELQESEARYREVFDESPIGIWEEDWSKVKQTIDKLDLDEASDLAGHIDANPDLLGELFTIAESGFDVSQAVHEMYEMPDHDALVRWRREEGHREGDLVAFREFLIKLHEQQWTHQYEDEYVLPSGKLLAFSIQMVVPKSRRHDWSRVIYAVDNITELKQAEGLLNQAARLAGIGYYVWDATEDRYLYCSDQHANIHGLSPEEYVRRATGLHNDRRLVHPEDRPAIIEAMRNLRHGDAINIEYRALLPDGSSRYIREFIESVFDDEDILVREIGSSQDITEQKLVEQQLRQSQKLEAIGRLTGGVAHDFNNLLAVIMGNAELLLEEDSGNRSMLKSVMNAAKRGAALTQQLLAFSLEQTLAPKAVNINRIIEDLLQMLARTLGETIQISRSLDVGLWPAFVDLNQVENAILNLAINSRDAMPDGGKLLIETANIASDDIPAESRFFLEPGDYVMLAITDNGHGMSEEVVEKAFEPFFTTKDASKGSGLGLAMVFGFVKQSGGHVEILSKPDEGTTVHLCLPRASDSTESEAIVDIEQAPVGNGETIFLIEDNSDVRSFVEKLLRNLGYSVTSAADASEALRKLPKMKEPDLLLSDVVLPGGVNGPDVATQILQTWPELPVLFMTGHADDTVQINELTPFSAEIIRKPFRKADLATIIQSILHDSVK